MVLTEEQSEELHKIVLAYLKESKFKDSFEALKAQVKLKPESKRNLLASKWRSIMKLNKQIMDLEAKGKVLKEDLDSMGKSSGKVDAAHKLPRAPAKFVLKGHSDVITACKFHPKFGQAATASEDASVRVWDVETGAQERSMTGHQDAVQAIAFHPDGSQLASASADLTVKIWDMEEYKCLKTLEGHEHNISGVCWSKSGKRLFTCSRDKTIKTWDTKLGICRETLEGHTEWVRQVVVSPNGKMLASCSVDQTIKLWDLSGEETKCVDTAKVHEHIVEAVAFSTPAAEKCIVAHCLSEEDRKAYKAQEAKRKEEEGKDYVEGSGRFVLSGARDRNIVLYDTVKKAPLLTLSGHKNWVRGVVFHPGGQFIISCSDDKSIRVWDLEKKGECTRTLESAHELFVSCLDIAARMPLMVSGGVDKALCVWELK